MFLCRLDVKAKKTTSVELSKTKLVKSALRGLTRSRPLQLPKYDKYDEFWDVDLNDDSATKATTSI